MILVAIKFEVFPELLNFLILIKKMGKLFVSDALFRCEDIGGVLLRSLGYFREFHLLIKKKISSSYSQPSIDFDLWL